MLKLCSNRAKAKTIVKLFFDVCCLFFDLFHIIFDLVRFCSVCTGPKYGCALTRVNIALTSTNLGEDDHDLAGNPG